MQTIEIETTKRNSFLLLSFIIATAIVLRLLYLGSAPNGFFCDEASRGYDAYSILLTGYDRHGEFFPLYTKSFGDYPSSLYVFFTIPFVYLLGLSEFAVRLPAALSGVVTIPLLYMVVKEFFNIKTALITCGLLTISPWHIQFSRNASGGYLLWLLFFLMALIFFIKAVKRRPNFLLVSMALFSLSCYSYYSARVFVPLFVSSLYLIYWRELWIIRKITALSLLLLVIYITPQFLFWISPEGMARAGATLEISFLKNLYYYLSFFDPSFLFFKGDTNLRHSILNMGQLYMYEIVLLTIGLIVVVARSKRKEYSVILLWLLLYPVPASLTGPAHAGRAIIGAPLFSLISAIGMAELWEFFKRDRSKKLFLITTSTIIMISLILFIKRYFIDYPKYSASNWQYGMKEIVNFVEKSHYKSVFMTSSVDQAHIHILFYTKYPPEKYLTAPLPDRTREDTKWTLGKYHVPKIPFRISDPSLFILRPNETEFIVKGKIPHRIVNIIKYPMGKTAFYLIEMPYYKQ